MELQVVLIGAVVFVISAILIYLISAFTMKEKTFEEVIAEQRRQQEAEMLKAKSEKKAEKDVRKRFKKKEKPKAERSPKVSESDKEHKMVNLELEPEIIEPMEDKPLKATKKNKPAKPILVNKDEKSQVAPESFVQGIVHHGPPPMDDLELKHAHEKKSKKEAKEKARKQEAKPVVEEVMKVSVNKVQSAAPPASSDAKTSFKDKPEGAHAVLISSVKSAALNDGEVQALIDILLNKQGGSAAAVSADWSKKSQKGDPVAMLRKQLEEKERSLQEEQQMVMTANTKNKEIRQELSQEKLKFQAMEKSYTDKMDYQNREVQALHSRIQQTHEQHAVETAQMRAMIQKLESQVGDQSRVQRLVDENKVLRDSLTKAQTESLSPAEASSLKQKVSIMEKELGSNALKLNTSENTRKTAEQKLAKVEAELKKYESQQSSNESVISKRVDEMSQELRKSEAKSASMTKDLRKAEQAVETAHKECVSLKSKLQELEKALTDSDQSTRAMEERVKESDRHKIDMEGNLKNLQKRIEDYAKDKNEMLAQIQTLKQENNSLSTELKTSQERQQGEGQESPSKAPIGALNGDIHTEDAKEPTVTVVEHEKILSEKTMEINSLATEVEKRKSEVSTLQQDFEAQKKKNNEQLVASQTELESFDKSVMQRLFPDISVNKKGHNDWMTEFEKQVSSHLTSIKQQQASSDNSAKFESRIHELESRSSELEKQLREAEESRDSLQSSVQEAENNCTKLQSQVAQYRSVLGETENKLTQLENSVEAEESKWLERLQGKELELQQAQQEVSNLRGELQVFKSTGSQEMKEKVEYLESQLKASDDRCLQLETQVIEAEGKVEEYRLKIVEVEKNSANTTELNHDLEELKRLLEAEKKKNKELASNVVKLNGIIKTGHDALTQEQNLVEKLRSQLASGDQNSSAVPNDTNSEVIKLRAKLEEREKHLEKEINSNKLLSQRLASSQGSLNEAGTSV